MCWTCIKQTRSVLEALVYIQSTVFNQESFFDVRRLSTGKFLATNRAKRGKEKRYKMENVEGKNGKGNEENKENGKKMKNEKGKEKNEKCKGEND